MSDLDKSLADYFTYLMESIHFWKSIISRINVLLKPLSKQCEQLRLCHRVEPDDKFLQEFPCVKEKLLGKIRLCIEEEMQSILKVEEEMKCRLDGMKTRLTSVDKAYSKYKCEESFDFNPLIPSYDILVEQAIDVWKCFHLLWMSLKTSLDTVDYLSESSVNNIHESLMRFDKLEPHFKYVAELTQYLRT